MVRDRSVFICAYTVDVFVYSSFQFSFRFANVLFCAFRTGDDIYYVACIASDVASDIVGYSCDRTGYFVSFLYELTLVAGTTAFGVTCVISSGLFRDGGPDKDFSHIGGLSEGSHRYFFDGFSDFLVMGNDTPVPSEDL